MKLTANPVTQETVSSTNGGSYSASFSDMAKLHAREVELCARIAAIYREECGGGLGLTYPIYCGG